MNGNMEQVRDACADNEAIDASKLPSQPTIGGEREWCMISARSGGEINVANGLRRFDLPGYWPSYEEAVISRDHAGVRHDRMVRRALIPGIVFGPVGAIALVDRIRDAFGPVLTFSGNPLLLTERDIALLRSIELAQNRPAVPTKADHHKYKIGDKVRLLDDLMAIWPPGKITRLAHGGRISVEVSLMARKVNIKVLPHQIERI